MARRLLRACLCTALLAPWLPAGPVTAKPPDVLEEQEESPRPQLLDPEAVGNEDAPAAAGCLLPAAPALRAQFKDFPPPLALPALAGEQSAPLRFGLNLPLGDDPEVAPTDSIILVQVCEPANASQSPRREMLPLPGLYQLRPSVRRQVAGSLLFSVHPVMALVPTERLLDCPSDHPLGASPATCRFIPPAPWLVQAMPQQQPAAPPCDSGACTRSRSKPADRHVYPLADTDLSQEVLPNLEKVEAGHQLIRLAKHLAHNGQEWEALECFGIACGLCPGRFEDQFGDLVFELLAAEYGFSTEAPAAGEEAAAVAGPEFELLPAPKPEKKSSHKKHDIERRLKAKVNLNFKDVPLRQVLDDLSGWGGLNICVDQTALEEEGRSLDRPVTIKVERVSLKTALHLILRATGLTYVVKDEVLHVTTCPHDHGACLKCGRLHLARAQGTAEQVEGLMKACRLAAEAGRHARAAELAREAFALDAERVLADPLVYKMHLLALKRDKGKGRHCRPDRDPSRGCEPVCPAAPQHESKAEDAPESLAPPALPPVDSAVIGALERLLEESEARPEEAPHHPAGVSLHNRYLDLDCSWKGLRVQGQFPLCGSLYHVQFWNGAVSGWRVPDPAELNPGGRIPERVHGGIQ